MNPGEFPVYVIPKSPEQQQVQETPEVPLPLPLPAPDTSLATLLPETVLRATAPDTTPAPEYQTILQRVARAHEVTESSTPTPSELDILLRTSRTIAGGRALVRFNDQQWSQVLSKIEVRCREFLRPATNADDALLKADILSAILSVSVFEIAQEIDPRRGFMLRTNMGHAKRGLPTGHRQNTKTACCTHSPTKTFTCLHAWRRAQQAERDDQASRKGAEVLRRRSHSSETRNRTQMGPHPFPAKSLDSRWYVSGQP